MTAPFSDRLIDAVGRRGPLCVGLDPHPNQLPPLFGPPGPAAFERFFVSVLEVVVGRAAVVKPQIALFERWGPKGLASLARIVSFARGAGVMVLLDAKRGDIGSTAEGYAAAYLGADAWLPADAVTVNPYMGLDTLAPWIIEAKRNARGVIVLLRTSNPGAADMQELDAGGAPVWARLAERLAPVAEDWRGETGWSSLMAVVGATAPAEARAARERLASAPFLVPGYGAQGASAADAMAGARDGQGVIVNASRSVLYPAAAAEAATESEWADAVAAAIDDAQAELKTAAAA